MSRKVTLNALDFFCSSEGCFLNGGKLTPAYTAVKEGGNLPDDTVFATYSPATGHYFACGSGATYYSGDGSNFVKTCNYGRDAFLVEDYSGDMPRSIIITGDRATEVTPASYTVEVLSVRLSCGAMHCGRLFAADGDDGYMLRWSGTGGVSDWNQNLNGSGYLCLDKKGGKILNILPFGQKLAAIRQNAITLLNMQSEPEKFSVSFNDCACAEVVANTACAVSGKLYFFTATGMKVFDGNKISPYSFRHAGEISDPQFCIVYDGKYFIACKSKTKGCEVIVCIDLNSGESCLFDGRACRMFLKDGVAFSDLSGFWKVVPAEKFTFESGDINFGTGRRKTVVNAFIEGVCDFQISNGKTVRKFSSFEGLIRPKLNGKSFKIKVTGKGEISKIELCAEVLNGI